MNRTDALAAAAARYTNPAVMAAHIEANPNDVARCYRIATNPEGRFGLTSADTAAVVAWMGASLDVQEALACNPSTGERWAEGVRDCLNGGTGEGLCPIGLRGFRAQWGAVAR